MKSIRRLILTSVIAFAAFAINAGTSSADGTQWTEQSTSGAATGYGAGGSTEQSLTSVGLPYMGQEYGSSTYGAAPGGSVDETHSVGLPYFGEEYGSSTYGAGAGGSVDETHSVGLPYLGQDFGTNHPSAEPYGGGGYIR